MRLLNQRTAGALLLLAGLAISPAAAQTAAPAITFVTPTSATTGDPVFNLIVAGAGFAQGAGVLWNETLLATAFTSPAQLIATVPASLLATAGNITITVRNPDGAVSNGIRFPVIQALAISTALLPNGTLGVPYSAALSVAGGTPPYGFRIVGALPDGLTLSPAGAISGTPEMLGTFTFSVEVVDSRQRTAHRPFTVVIGSTSLSIATATIPAGLIDAEYGVTFAASSGTPPFRWAILPGPPPGLVMNAESGRLSGIPSARGSYSFQVEVVDSAGLNARKNFTLMVRSQPLSITTLAPLFTATAGVPYSLTFAAAGGLAPYRWAIDPGTVTGLRINALTGSFTGTPQTPGQVEFTVQVTDSERNTATKAFTLTVDPPRLTIATSSPLPGGTAGAPYSLRFAVSGGTAPYAWSIASGAVPGLSLNAATGVLESVPTDVGTFTFNVQVRDASGLTGSKTFVLTIAPGALRITPLPSVFSATLGTAFSAALSATGGVPPYTWSANSLPSGVTMDEATGQISGTPAAGGTFLFTARVTDSARTSATELFQLAVAFPPLPAFSAADLSQVATPGAQPRVQLALDAPYAVDLNGELLLNFAPEGGRGDPGILFSTGGRSVPFTIPAGQTAVQFAAPGLAFQTGTVAGTIQLTARVQAAGLDVTSSPVPVHSMRVEPAAPVIRSARFTRTSSGIEVRITGFSTARAVTQAVFQFAATGNATLQSPEVTVGVESLFAGWFENPESAPLGSQFEFTQSFTVQGDANLIAPVSVRLVNGVGSTSAGVTAQ